MSGSFAYFINSRRFLVGFAVGNGISASLYMISLQRHKEKLARPGSTKKSLFEAYGFPQSGTEPRQYVSHALSYDQEKKIPRWVIEHLTKEKTVGNADRKHCKFKPDPNIPPKFSATNEDYLKSGWSRGHMAPAGDAKFSKEAMAETFYLSNIVPQNYENNAGFWNRFEMYCRDLAERFDDVWVVSGPLTLPVQDDNGEKRVTYEVIGKDDVAVPSHLFKVILARKSGSANVMAEGAFIVPNIPISFDHQLPEYQVELEDLEKKSGLVFFPEVDRDKTVSNLCKVDTCKLMELDEFKLYVATRRMKSAQNLQKVEKIMKELEAAHIQPDKYLLDLYEQKMRELSTSELYSSREGKRG